MIFTTFFKKMDNVFPKKLINSFAKSYKQLNNNLLIKSKLLEKINLLIYNFEFFYGIGNKHRNKGKTSCHYCGKTFSDKLQAKEHKCTDPIGAHIRSSNLGNNNQINCANIYDQDDVSFYNQFK